MSDHLQLTGQPPTAEQTANEPAAEPAADAVDEQSERRPIPSWIQRLRLLAPEDIAPLAFFRIFFGMVMTYHVIATMRDHWVSYFYVQPPFHLTYPGFSWVRPWPGEGMYYHFAIMGIASFGVMVGCCYRFCAAVYAFCFTYVFLIEKGLYQNHYYLICLLSFMLIFMPAHHLWSVDSWRKPQIKSQTAPQIWLRLLQLQLGIAYFYGGIAKLNYDWLHGMPVRMWLERRTWVPVIGEWMSHDFSVFFVAWGGLLFDLLVVPALIWKRTRVIAFIAAVAFHVSNHFLWNIGIFPWFMIGATLLFFPPSTIRRLCLSRRLNQQALPTAPTTWNPCQRLVVSTVALYVSWQLLFPFRHFLYPGNVSWTEEGHHFAWHMMLREKSVGLRIYMHNRQTGERGLLNLRDFVNERQLSRMGKDADMILELVHFVRDQYAETGQDDIEFRVLALASLNGRKPQLMVDPHIDYAKVDRKLLGHQPWIIPLSEPFRDEAWHRPLNEWDSELSHLIPEDMKLGRAD